MVQRRPEPVVIPIPIDGGLDSSTDQDALRPPRLETSTNMHSRRGGALRKRPGSTDLYNAGFSLGNPLLVGGEGRALLMGESSPRLIASDGSTRALSRAPLPLKLDRTNLFAGRGFVHSVQATSSANYTCVVASLVGDTTIQPSSGSNVGFESDYEVVAAILDANDNLVWGPYRMPTELKWLPRVECVDDGNFVITALGTTTYSDSFILRFTTVHMYACEVNVGVSGGAVGATSYDWGSVWPSQDGTTLFVYKMYDTCTTSDGSTPGNMIVTFPRYNAAAKELRTVITSDGTLGTPNDVASVATTNDHLATHYDTTSDTYLVYDRANARVLYWTSAVSGAPGTVAAPSLSGIDTATVHQETLGPHSPTPVFFDSAAGNLHLNEILVTLTGSGPATPSFGASSEFDEPLPMLYEPFVLGVSGFKQTFFTYAGVGSARGYSLPAGATNRAWRRGASAVEVYHQEDHDSFSDKKPVFDAVVGESRLGTHNHSMFTMFVYLAATRGGSWIESPCVTGQLGGLGGKQLALPLLTSQQHDRTDWIDVIVDEGEGSYGTWQGPVGTDNLGNKAGMMSDGAGWYNDEQVVSCIRLSDVLDQYSAFSHESSRIIAHGGMVSLFANNRIVPLALRAPTITESVASSVYPSRYLDADMLGFQPAYYTAIFQSSSWLVAVLVYTDENGLEHRSPPSNRQLSTFQGDEEAVTVCHSIGLTIHPATLAFFGDTLALDVEIYTTTRRNPDGSAATERDESTYTLVQRMPLQLDADGYFTYDTLADLFQYDDDPTPATTLISCANNPPHTNALYTITEQPAAYMPACSVMASAGNYLFALSVEDEYEVWSSKPLQKGRAPEFSPALTNLLPPESGGCISLASSYDRLYALCRRGVYELPVLGGPDANGDGGFPPWRLTFSGEPCVSHAGTVRTPVGAFYMATNGPHLIDNSGTDQHIGQAIENTVADFSAVRAALYVPERKEVRWFFQTFGVSLDLASGAWAYDSLGGEAACLLDNQLVRWKTFRVRLEDDTQLTDGADSFAGYVRTGWIDTGGANGFQRVMKVTVQLRLHNVPASGGITVGLWRDYSTLAGSIAGNQEEQRWELHSWTAAELSTLMGGDPGPVRLEVVPVEQNMSALAIVVSETLGTDPIVLGTDLDWSLVSIQIEALPTGGLVRLPVDQRS